MKIIYLLLVCLLISSSLFAQIDLTVKEETRSMQNGSANALVLPLPNTSYKKVNKLWSKYVRNFKGKSKYNKKINEHFSDNATIPDMSDNTVDIIARVEDKGEQGTEITVWYNLGVIYLSSEEYPERYLIGEKLLYNFGLLVSADIIEAQIEEEEKQLVTYTDEFKELQKAKTKEESNIEKQKEIILKAQQSIKNSEKTIEENIAAQAAQQNTIEEQQKLIEEMKRKLKEVQRKK